MYGCMYAYLTLTFLFILQTVIATYIYHVMFLNCFVFIVSVF